MDKLERERSSTMRIHISALEYIGGEKIKELKLNGREIRNGTLLSLVYYEAWQYVVECADHERRI